MKKKVFIGILVVILSFSSYWAGYSAGKDRDEFFKDLDIFAEGLALIDKQYVEDIPSKDLIYGAMTGLLASLDSYSQFLTPEEYQELIIETEGEFGGLGIEITLKDNLLTVVSPIEGTPAWDAGVKPGDIIVKIDGELTRGINLTEAVKRLRGAPGSEVVITVLREKIRQLKDITIARSIIKIKDIKNAQILENGIGYIRIAEFRENTALEMDKVLNDLKAQGLKGLVIDVRNNPGGLLYSAIEVVSRFLDDDKVIVSTKSRTENEMVYKAIPLKEKYLDIPIVVLINQGSASASEILASALRDNSRAVLLGETTFGKGSVQTVVTLSDNSALRLTTSKYYAPAGESIHEKGVVADIEVIEQETVKEKEEEVFDEVEKKKEFDYKKDCQVVRAVDLIKGILILGRNK